MASSNKTVKVIARYTNKQTGTVSYLVESSDGTSQYCTTLIDGKASGCSCPAHSKCYHKTQLEAKEAERAEYRRELAKKLAQQYMTAQVVMQMAEGLTKKAKVAKKVGISIEQVQEIAVIALEHKADIAGSKHTELTRPIGPRDTKKDWTKAALTTNRGFSLMK